MSLSTGSIASGYRVGGEALASDQLDRRANALRKPAEQIDRRQCSRDMTLIEIFPYVYTDPSGGLRNALVWRFCCGAVVAVVCGGRTFSVPPVPNITFRSPLTAASVKKYLNSAVSRSHLDKGCS